MGKKSYLGGHTIVQRGSDWFSGRTKSDLSICTEVGTSTFIRRKPETAKSKSEKLKRRASQSPAVVQDTGSVARVIPAEHLHQASSIPDYDPEERKRLVSVREDLESVESPVIPWWRSGMQEAADVDAGEPPPL
jgi:hypothetical protein